MLSDCVRKFALKMSEIKEFVHDQQTFEQHCVILKYKRLYIVLCESSNVDCSSM